MQILSTVNFESGRRIRGLSPAVAGDEPLRLAEAGGGSGLNWGNILGTLSNQTDLQAALDAKANRTSPAFLGVPTAPSPTLGTDNTQLATTEWVNDTIAAAAFINWTNITGKPTTVSGYGITDFDERVDDRVAVLIVPGTGINATYNDAAGTLTIAANTGLGDPGGNNHELQFNNNGVFGGITNWVDTTGGNLRMLGGGRLVGDFSSGTLGNRGALVSYATNTETVVPAIPNGSGGRSGWMALDTSVTTDAGYVEYGIDTTGPFISNTKIGTGVTRRFRHVIDGVQAWTVFPDGNMRIGTGTTNPSKRLLVEGEGEFVGRLQLIASDVTVYPLVIPHGTAPTTAPDGTVWTTTGGLYARINGVDVGPFLSSTSPGAAGGTNGQLQYNSSGVLAGLNVGTGLQVASGALNQIAFTTTNIGGVPAPGTLTGKFLRDDGTWQSPVGAAAGADTQVLFNDGGTTGADAKFTWDKVNFVLGVVGDISVGSSTASTARQIKVPDRTTNGAGAKLSILGGRGFGGSGAGSAIDIIPGQGSSSTGNGGLLTLQGGLGGGNGNGGGVLIQGGQGAGSGNAGNVDIVGATNASTSSLVTGYVSIRGGPGTYSNASGGHVYLEGGTPAGSGAGGQVIFQYNGTRLGTLFPDGSWNFGPTTTDHAYRLRVEGSGAFTGALTLATPGTSQESLILPHGAAPTAPTDGSIWTSSVGLFVRVNGVTVGPLLDASGVSGVSSFNTRTGAVTLTSLDVTNALTFTPYDASNPASYVTASNLSSQLANYALLAGPEFSGNPTVPDQLASDNSTRIANTKFVQSIADTLKITAKDEGTNLTTFLKSLNFVGSGVVASQSAGDVTVTIPGGGTPTLDIKDEGTSLTTSPLSLNFVGAGVTATESAGNVTVTIAGGGGSGTSKVTASAVSLGTQIGVQTNYVYYTVSSICARGLVSLLKITTSSLCTFDLVIRGAASDSGELYLQALNCQRGDYTIRFPWYYENDAAGQQFYIGIKNRTGGTFSFTLANLRVEKFA